MMIIDQLLIIHHYRLSRATALERLKVMIVTITTGISTTIKSAQSKKCRLLEKVRNGSVDPKVAIAIRNVDDLLASVMSEADVNNASLGLKPNRGGGKGGIKLTVEI